MSKVATMIQMALCEDTGEHEAAAAFNALRRMVKKDGIDAIMEGISHTVIQERVVYRDRPVGGDHTMTMTLTVPMVWQHSIMMVIINDCFTLKISPEILECKTTTGNTIGSMVVKFKFHGSKDALLVLDDAIDDYMAQMRIAD